MVYSITYTVSFRIRLVDRVTVVVVVELTLEAFSEELVASLVPEVNISID